MLNLLTDQAITIPKKKNTMLPILVVLFLISYGLMSLLVVEQGRTIDSQKNLIHDLFSDSVQLNAMKIKEMLRQRAAAHPAAPGRAGSQSQQVTPPSRSSNNAAKTQKPALQKPPKPTADTVDARRIPLAI